MIRSAAIVFALLLGGCQQTVGRTPQFASAMAPVGTFAIPMRSMLEQRYAGIVRQKYDFSCGSAALATLLRYHYRFAVGEEDAFRGMWEKGDRAQIRRVGFSLLDMKRWLASHRLNGDGYKVTLDDIAKTGVPGIALISVKDYRHFVVVKGVRGDEVLLGDPSTGVSVMPGAKFQAAWNGIYFVLSNDQPLAKRQFNRTDQWLAYARAPVGTPFNEPVSLQALAITAPQIGDI